MFKKGDRVRILGGVLKGKFGTVAGEYNNYNLGIWVDGLTDGHSLGGTDFQDLSRTDGWFVNILWVERIKKDFKGDK